MVLDISLLEKLKTRYSFFQKVRRSLYFKLGALLLGFTFIIVLVLYYQFNYSFSTQDSILDSQEAYFYSRMVEDWELPLIPIRLRVI